MKYKLIAIFLIFFLLISCFIASGYYNEDLSYVYHQHLEDNKDESACKGCPNCSHLPIVNIKTKNQVIPSQKQAYITGDVYIYDNGKKVNNLGDDDSQSIKTRIRYRGRSSLSYDKKGYSLKFVNNKDKKISKPFLGMSSDSDWVLHGPYIDKSLIRNYMWYNISHEIMGDAPDTRFLELYVDDTYQGLYVAVEAVTQNANSRVKMSPLKKDSIATSYLIQLDSDKSLELADLESLTKYTGVISDPNLYLTIKYPSDDVLTEDIKKYIYDDFNSFEKMLYSYDYKDYEKYIDVDSFVDYFIINEFTQNYDIGYLSTYIYKDIFGKYKMYVWDFDSASNNYQTDYLAPGKQGFELVHIVWFNKLMKDPKFVERVISRYTELRKSYLSTEYLNNYIDDTVAYLGDAVSRNFDVWGYTFSKKAENYKTNFMPSNYDEAVSHLKSSIKKRSEWLDNNIDNLRFYCHPSHNKKYNK